MPCKCNDYICKITGSCGKLASIESEFELAADAENHELCMQLMVRFNEIFNPQNNQKEGFSHG